MSGGQGYVGFGDGATANFGDTALGGTFGVGGQAKYGGLSPEQYFNDPSAMISGAGTSNTFVPGTTPTKIGAENVAGNTAKKAARNGWVDGSMIALTGYGAYNENENSKDALKEQKKVNKHNMRLADNAETRRAEMDVGNEAGFGLAMEDARKRARRQKTVG